MKSVARWRGAPTSSSVSVSEVVSPLSEPEPESVSDPDDDSEDDPEASSSSAAGIVAQVALRFVLALCLINK